MIEETSFEERGSPVSIREFGPDACICRCDCTCQCVGCALAGNRDYDRNSTLQADPFGYFAG